MYAGKTATGAGDFREEALWQPERLVTQKLLDVVKRVAREELGSEKWLRTIARLSGRSYKQMRVMILEFLDTDMFHVSGENCVSFLNPLIESWDIDLSTFGIEIVLNQRLALGHRKDLSSLKSNATILSRTSPGSLDSFECFA